MLSFRGYFSSPMSDFVCALSIVLPARDERENLPPLLDEIEAAIAALPERWRPAEIVVVDDGSTDGTGEWLRVWAAGRPGRRQVIAHDRARGQSWALWSGFQAARGAVVATLDADGQNDPADLRKLLSLLDEHDLVCGIRVTRRDRWSKRLASRIGNGARNFLLGERILDTGCSLKAMRAEFLPRLPWFDGAHRFIPALFSLFSARIAQQPVNHRPRLRGRTHYGSLLRGVRGLRDICRLRRFRRRLQRGLPLPRPVPPA